MNILENIANQPCDWKIVPHVPQVVFVAYRDEMPVGVVELNPLGGYRATTTAGVDLGAHATLDEAKGAVQAHLTETVV